MNLRITLGALVCFSVVGINSIESVAQDLDIPNKRIVQGETVIKERYIDEDNVPVKKLNTEIADELGCLSKNDKVEVIDFKEDWGMINYKDCVGYVQLKYLKKAEKEISFMYIDNIDKVNVLKEPKKSNDVLGSIEIGSRVKVINDIGDYMKIEFNGESGYVLKEYVVDKLVRVVSDEVVLKKVGEDEISSPVVLEEGESIDVLELGSKVSRVSSVNADGYISNENISDVQYLINGKTELLVAPRKESDIKTYIPKGTKVNVISYDEEYVKVKVNSYEGYVQKDSISRDRYAEELNIKDDIYFSDIEVSKEVIQEEFNEKLKELDSKKTKKKDAVSIAEEYVANKYEIDKVNSGDTVKVLSNKGSYLEVNHNEKVRVIENKGVLKSKKEDMKYIYIHTDKDYEIDKDIRFTSVDDVEVYKDADKKYILGYLVEDSKVRLVRDLGNGISEVEINGGKVYIESDVLSIKKMYTKKEEKINSINTNKSHQVYVDNQFKKLNMNLTTKGSRKATYEELALYSNPKKMSVYKDEYKYQYLKLNKFREVNAGQLDLFLRDLKTSKVNIFKDKAEVFIEAAKMYDIDVIYLVSHTLLESGFGSSKLAQGNKDKNGDTVYNFWGIGAVDSNPINAGVALASKEGWTSVEKAIYGSAKWIAEKYIHSEKYKQDTLYKMRYNYNYNSAHQYATDIGWCKKISKFMNELSYMYDDVYLEFEVPVYNKGTDAKNKVNKEEVDSNKVEVDSNKVDDKKDEDTNTTESEDKNDESNVNDTEESVKPNTDNEVVPDKDESKPNNQEQDSDFNKEDGITEEDNKDSKGN